jgi:hypothetical protein
MINRAMCLALASLLLAGCGGPEDCDPPDEAILFADGFESGGLSCWYEGGNAATVSTEYARLGTHSLKSSLDRLNDRNPYRTEVRHGDYPDTHVGDENWYAFSTLLPEPYVPDRYREVIAQWHDRPDTKLGEDWRVPPLRLTIDEGRWTVTRTWDAKPNSHVNGKDADAVYDGMESYDLGPVRTEVWNDWVFHVKWSYQADGVLQVWRDGEKVVEVFGPNAFNDVRGTFFKMGMYKVTWKDPDVPSDAVNSRVVYHDEFKMGNGAASFADFVLPPQEPAASRN